MYGVAVFLCILLLGSPSQANSLFVSPRGDFSLEILAGWRYQPEKSTDRISVFYGPHSYDIFYIEELQEDFSPLVFAHNVKDAYAGPHGLKDFAVVWEAESFSFPSGEAVVFGYSFTGEHHPLFEIRVLVLGPRNYSITVGSAPRDETTLFSPWLANLSTWRWQDEE